MVDCFARTIRGIEWVAAAEVEGRLGGTVTGLGHREVRFTVPDAGPDLLGLRTVDDVFVTVARLAGLDHTRRSLAALADQVRPGDVDRASAAAAVVRGAPAGRRFEVVASALGRRNYNRGEIEDAVGGALDRRIGRYVPRRDGVPPPEVDLTLRVHLVDDGGTIGLRAGPAPLHRRTWKQASIVGTLHPPVAAALALLAGVGPDVTLLDPFCGAGTVGVEHLLLGGGAAVGSDIDTTALAAAVANAASAGVDGTTWARADATAIPVGTGTVDVVATNPPWDRRLPAADGTRLLVEVDRVIGAGGRAVVLTEAELPDVDPVARIPLSLFGARPDVVVLGAAATPAAPALLAAELARHAHEA